ncbi:MAG: hypothetical protein EOO10_15640 [Chitinophagaceae bacterium]|nr:MAG: hypothetical protein EOO10_15640 [Chitinophagaceae bacterium]
MKKYIDFFCLVICFQLKISAQDFLPVALTAKDKKNNALLARYQTSIDKYAGGELLLYKTGKFVYNTYSCLANGVSAGQWKAVGNIIELQSDWQQNNLPIKISYIDKATAGEEAKQFAIIRDLAGREYTQAAIHINQDSVSCYYGDKECFGSYTSVDSVKVQFDNNLVSRWLKVDTSEGVVQLTVLTNLDVNQYFPLYLRLKKEKGRLKPLKE